MQKNVASISSRSLVKSMDWDPQKKEPWLLEFENLPVNDEKWSCLVTSAIQAKAEDEEYIKIYKEFVSTGPQKFNKVISKSDIISTFKKVSGSLTKLPKTSRPPLAQEGKGGEKKKKEEKIQVEEKTEDKPKSPLFNQLQNLVYKYGKCNESDCEIHPQLAAILIKYMILKIKEINIRERKINAVKKRKMKERELKAKFIRDLKPFEASEDGPKIPIIPEPEDDEPIEGPDLFIMLTDFLDPDCYPELIKINVPFVAFLKTGSIANLAERKNTTSLTESSEDQRKSTSVDHFWENLENVRNGAKEGYKFKDMALIKYDTSGLVKDGELNMFNQKIICDELTWMQYAAYRIYTLHKKFIREFHVQKVSVSLEPFDLSKCDVYNKLCDALLTGQSFTPLFILYAMIEQLVAGVPETESKTSEFELNTSDYFPQNSESIIMSNSTLNKSAVNLVTPCVQCRNKADYFMRICGPIDTKEEWLNVPEDEETTIRSHSSNTKSTSEGSSKESRISTTLLDQILSERKSEKEMKKDRKWKSPVLCFHGDSLTLETYHCDRRLIDIDSLLQRFFKNIDLFKIWEKYPELPPEHRAFFNFHYDRLLKISKLKEDTLKLKVLFTLLMKVSGMSKSYYFRGEESALSEKLSEGWRSRRILSKATAPLLQKSGFLNGFSNFYFKTFILTSYENNPKKTGTQIDAKKISDSNFAWTVPEDSTGHLHRNSGNQSPQNFMNLGSLAHPTAGHISYDKSNALLSLILDCFDLSLLTDFDSLKKNEDFQALIKNFNYYEQLQPTSMIQRLSQPRDSYNTIHCTYFPPTDSLAILMYNDSDHRGIFFRLISGSLSTPVALRDFYSHLLPEMKGWIVQDIAESLFLISKHVENEAALEEKRNEKYLARLKHYYCSLSEKARKEFLEQKIDFTTEPEVKDTELRELPPKVKLDGSNRTTFHGFDFRDLRIESNTKLCEFHSKDGMEVHVALDSWLYDSSELLTLTVKRSSLSLRYFLYLDESNEEVVFILKTRSDLRLVFYREDDTLGENLGRYNVRISWPTGLLIEVKSTSTPSNRYVKQSYLQSCRKGWEIEDEKSRCYLQTGEIIIFKESGDIKILTLNGTIHNIYYGERPRWEMITMTGAVWEQRIGKIRCPNKRKTSTVKVYIGVDCKTKETYYKRDDGVSCMLWPNGKLVTNYPDGTKITSIPEVEKEVGVDWSDDERKYFQEMETRQPEEMEQKSRTILRNSATRTGSRKNSQSEDFLLVSCTHLMEHPKYATVYRESKTSLIEIRMLENITVKTTEDGKFRVEQDDRYLIVQDDYALFNTKCKFCKDVSTSFVNFNSYEVCKTIDFFQNKFVVYKDGNTEFTENVRDSKMSENEAVKTTPNAWCRKQHTSCVGLQQRCFVIERDLSGIEFIHSENLASTLLQDDTYFDINTNDLTHTFSTPLSKIGYENWVMSYEKDDSIPINLKKKDLKEIDVRETRGKLFEYPFPQQYNVCMPQKNQMRKKMEMPKVNLVRIINSFSPNPSEVINEVSTYVGKYQKKARDICNEYKKRWPNPNANEDERYVNMRLKKIAVTLNQTLNLYPHLCMQVPSTEKDVHHFGHYINFMEDMKSHFRDPSELPDCKQIPQRLPCKTTFPTVQEEDEFYDF